MKRLRPATAGDDMILGEGEDVEGPEFVDFGANGKAQVRVAMNSCSGTWKAANGHVAIDLNGEVAERDYSIESDVLTLRSSGNEIKYNRRTRAR